MTNAIIQLVPTLQGVALAAHNIEKIKKKDINTKDILELGVTNIVGVGLLQKTAQLAAL